MELLQPGSWLPADAERWTPLIQALLTAFLRKFTPELLQKMLEDQQGLPSDAPLGARAVLLASACTAFHKICQILARNPMVPIQTRELLVSLESLPPSSIPEEARLNAIRFASKLLNQPTHSIRCTKVARGSVADVFRILIQGSSNPLALKIIRSDSASRVRSEAAILAELAEESAIIATVVGPQFANALSEALQDAADALLKEIDFLSEMNHLKDACHFYELNERIGIPKVIGPSSSTGIFMEFLQGMPVLDNALSRSARREIAQKLFRSVILEPLFSGLPEAIFHADPHAGNIQLQADKDGLVGEARILLLDWSQAGKLPASVAHALIELCLNCMEELVPSRKLIERILEQPSPFTEISLPEGGTPLTRALEIIQQLAIEGMKVPAGLLLLRKSLLTIEAIAHQLDAQFDAWKETLSYCGWVGLSEAPFRLLTLALPWLDNPRVYRSGISTKLILAKLTNNFVRSHNFSLTLPVALCDSLGEAMGAQGCRCGIRPV